MSLIDISRRAFTRYGAGLLFVVLLMGCTKSRWKTGSGEIPQDTVYEGLTVIRENPEYRKAVIQLDNGAGDSARFSVGKTTLLRIQIPRFTEYEMNAEQAVGATIVKVDTALNKFLVTPNAPQFSFVLNQFYPPGYVVRYSKSWNESTSTLENQIVALTDTVKIAKLDFKAH